MAQGSVLVGSEPSGREAHEVGLGVSGRVAGRDHGVLGLHDHAGVGDQQGAERVVAVLTGRRRESDGPDQVGESGFII